MNKQTQHVDREKVKRKIDEGAPVTKAELSVFLGVGYATVRSWTWLPMLGNLLFYDDFIAARRLHLGLVPKVPANSGLRPSE